MSHALCRRPNGDGQRRSRPPPFDQHPALEKRKILAVALAARGERPDIFTTVLLKVSHLHDGAVHITVYLLKLGHSL